MSFADLITRMQQFDKNAEIIFDREEPIGLTTDLVMPRRRWFRKTPVLETGKPAAFQPSTSR
jgi:hypothetical protein